MSDIFISYARSTEAQAKQIAEALRGLGYGVWRDDELPAHRSYAEVIEERLQAAKAVVVIWSVEAVKSEWVQSEADTARTDHKLVQMTVDGAKPPRPFDRIQCADLTGWTGELDAPGWKKVVASVAELIGATAAQPTPSPAVRMLSICVLPFANMSGDPEQEYFSDGISEDIITDLSKVSALEVCARNTAFGFKGKSPNVKDVAHQLGVSHVLEGSVRKAGGRVRITAQLIDGATGNHLWAERYDRDLSDIFALQDEISEAIVTALKLKLLPEEKQAIERRGTDNVEAYNLYLMARRHYFGLSAKRQDLVIRLCQGAVDLDPTYALAWTLMALCKRRLSMSYADRADDNGWAETEQALALDPNLAEAHAAKSSLLRDQGEFDEAQSEAEIALAADPGSTEANLAAGALALARRRFPDAIRFFEAAAGADETNVMSTIMVIQCYEAIGDASGARAAARRAVDRVEKAVAREPDDGPLLSQGVGALTVAGEVERAHDWAQRALLSAPNDALTRANLACDMTRLGDVESALANLEAALELGGASLVYWAQTDSDLDLLREDPRFQSIMAKAGARLAAAKPVSETGA